MKQILLMIAVVGLVGCGKKKPLIRNHIEEAIREKLEKPEGELTKTDYEKVTELYLANNQLTDVTGLEKLTQLETLALDDNKLTSVKGLEKLKVLEATRDSYRPSHPSTALLKGMGVIAFLRRRKS